MSHDTTARVIGIDLAKNIFQLHGADKQGKVVFRERLSREGLIKFMSQHPACLVGIEACSGSHYWARCLIRMGHEVKIIPAQFVKPFVCGNKNDANDAKAIAEALMRPGMKFAGVNSIEQQDILILHNRRNLSIRQRTALSNQIRGLLADYGVVIPQGIRYVRSCLPLIVEDASNELTTQSRALFFDMHQELLDLDKKVRHYEMQIHQHVQSDERCQRIMAIEGVGPITASAMVAKVGNARQFNNSREFAAWLGAVPSHRASGGKCRMLGISKRGDRYLRTLLIHGARSVINQCHKKEDARSQWILNKAQQPGGKNKAAVALANKNARIIWALLTKNEVYCKAQ